MAPAVAGEVGEWVPGEFTPADAVLDGSLCLARIWGKGAGAQCRKRPLPGKDVCKSHSGHTAHGKVRSSLVYSYPSVSHLAGGNSDHGPSKALTKTHTTSDSAFS